jgi:hypothetical protein
VLTAPLAQAAPTGFSVTGSAGRDDLRVTFESGRSEIIFRPAVAVAATNSTCTSQNDPLTMRPRETRCNAPGSFDLTVDLRAGDDAITVELGSAPVDSLSILGGLRNDASRAAEAARIRGRAVTLAASEGDGDGRDRSVLRRTSVR